MHTKRVLTQLQKKFNSIIIFKQLRKNDADESLY